MIADIPGLIEGAHDGRGLGTRFLGHVDRCSVLLLLVDGTLDDPVLTYRTIRKELKAYGHGLERKPEIVALNKMDAVDEETFEKRRAALAKAARKSVLAISGAARQGVDEALGKVLAQVQRARRPRQEAAEAAVTAETALG